MEKPVESNSLEYKLDLDLAGSLSGSVLGFGSQFRLIVFVVGKAQLFAFGCAYMCWSKKRRRCCKVWSKVLL